MPEASTVVKKLYAGDAAITAALLKELKFSTTLSHKHMPTDASYLACFNSQNPLYVLLVPKTLQHRRVISDKSV